MCASPVAPGNPNRTSTPAPPARCPSRTRPSAPPWPPAWVRVGGFAVQHSGTALCHYWTGEELLIAKSCFIWWCVTDRHKFMCSPVVKISLISLVVVAQTFRNHELGLTGLNLAASVFFQTKSQINPHATQCIPSQATLTTPSGRVRLPLPSQFAMIWPTPIPRHGSISCDNRTFLLRS